MIVMFLFYNDERAMAAMTQQQRNDLVDRHIAFNTEILPRRASVLMNRALEPTSAAVTVRPVGCERIVTDGPFADVGEVFSGFYLIECADMIQAVELAKEYPMPEGYGCIEVRPALQVWDYAPSLVMPVAASTVYQLYADVASWPRWKAGVDQVELDRPFGGGASGVLTPAGRDPMPFRIVSATPDQGYVSETELPGGVVLRLEHELAPASGGGTVVTHRVLIPRAALDTFGIEFSPAFNAGIRVTLQALSAAAVATESAHP